MAPSRAASIRRADRPATVIAILFALATFGVAGCAQTTSSGSSASTPSTPSTTVDAHAARVISDLAYGDDPIQEIDLYLPAGEGPFPVVLYLHSGGWVAGSHRYIPDFVLDQVDRGIAVASVDYRLAARGVDDTVTDAFPAPVADIDRAVRYVRAHATELSLDPDHVALAGASAGGHLALLAAAAPGRFAAADLPPELQSVSPGVQAVMAFVAPSDLVTFIDEDNELAESSLSTFLACPTAESRSCSVTQAAAASPATYLGPDAPPAYFVYGARDTLAPPATQGLPIALQWAVARGESLNAANAAVQLRVVDAGHNLDRSSIDLAALEEWLDASVR